MEPVEKAKILLKKILEKADIDGGHGFNHALAVLKHTDNALEHTELDSKTSTAIRLASLLHDADDRKFFPEGSSNARNILQQVSEKEISDLALKMIDLVSCSKNGIGRKGVESEWLFYPRWSDRLEALGKTGILRAYQYSLHRKRPLFNSQTPKTNSEVLLYGMIVKPKRLERYLQEKESETFIDHFYDKLLHLRKGFETDNPYYLSEVEKRHKVMENFVLEFCTTDNIQSLIEKYCF